MGQQVSQSMIEQSLTWTAQQQPTLVYFTLNHFITFRWNVQFLGSKEWTKSFANGLICCVLPITCKWSVIYYKMANVMNRNEVMLHVGSKQVPSNVNSNFSTIYFLATIIENLHKSNIYFEKVLDVNGPSRDSWTARTFIRILWK